MGHQAGHCLLPCTTDQLDDTILLPSIWPEQEVDLYNVVMQFAQRGFPFTDNKLCVLAYELTSRNNRKVFSPLKKHAGRSWLKGFLARYPQLKKKVSQNLSIVHAIGANPTQVGNFFNHYRRWIYQWGLEFQPNHIWNVDKCLIGDVPQTQKAIGLVGERPFQTVSGEKPVNTTLLTYVSAGGLYVPLW